MKIFLVILLSIACLAGCSALKPKPDYCAPDSGCRLDEPLNPPVSLKIGETKDNIQVCACKPWNSSGIAVKAGEVYRIEAKIKEDWKDSCIISTPNQGWKGFWINVVGKFFGHFRRSKAANWYALMGSVGRTADSAKEAFAVFKESCPALIADIEMPKTGRLYFFANDMEGRYGNNKGILNVSITLLSPFTSKRP